MGEGCRSTPRWRDVQLHLIAPERAATGVDSPGAWAHDSTEADAAGFAVWTDEAAGGAGACAAYVPAGSRAGFYVAGRNTPPCPVLRQGLERVLGRWADDPAAFTRAGVRPATGPLPFIPFGQDTVRGAGACVEVRQQYRRACAPHVARDVPATRSSCCVRARRTPSCCARPRRRPPGGP